MDKSDIEKQLPGLYRSRKTSHPPLKVYAETLDRNFELSNPSGKALPFDVEFHLTKRRIRWGWKKGANQWPREVNLFEISFMVDTQLPRSKS